MTSGRSFQHMSLCSVHTTNTHLTEVACGQEPEKGEEKEKEWGRETRGERKESKRENCTVTENLKLPFQPFPCN